MAFQDDLLRAAERNDVSIRRPEELLAALDLQPDETLINVFGGTRTERNEILILTTRGVFRLKQGAFGIKVRWSLWHEELEEVSAERAVGPGNYVLDSVLIRGRQRTYDFRTGFNPPDYVEEVRREIAAQDAQLIADEIRRAAGLSEGSPKTPAEVPSGALPPKSTPEVEAPQAPTPISFDPEGPEKAAEAAQLAYGNQEWRKALALYVKSVDRLHDFYVFEEFRNRQPSPGDAWMVRGVTKALGVLRQLEPEVDVAEPVREVTHRLRTICTAVEEAGGNPVLYANVLDEVGRLTPDVDVSDVLWR